MGHDREPGGEKCGSRGACNQLRGQPGAKDEGQGANKARQGAGPGQISLARTLMYKAHKKLLPNNLQLLISLDSDRGHITRQSNTFKQQVFARTTLKSQSISVQVIKLLNSLEDFIKSAKIY